jgi:hypothetical protein
MTKFTGDEKEYAFWKLSFQQLYSARQITDVEKVLYLLQSMEGEPHKLCKRFVRYQIDQTTYDTIWEVLDQHSLDKISKSWKSLIKSKPFPATT